MIKASVLGILLGLVTHLITGCGYSLAHQLILAPDTYDLEQDSKKEGLKV